MGADIHVMVERRTNNGWELRKNLDVDEATLNKYKNENGDVTFTWFPASARNYERFGRLANVRRSGPEPRGLPDDVSDGVREELESWGQDAHSVSYDTLEAFLEICLETDGVEALNRMRRYHPAWEFMELNVIGRFMKEYRVVFFFDN